MSDPMSERELSEIRALSADIEDCRDRGVHDSETNKEAAAKLPALLAEIDRQRGVMKEAADALEHYGRNSSLECYCCQHSVGHSEGCIVMRLRTAGEG